MRLFRSAIKIDPTNWQAHAKIAQKSVTVTDTIEHLSKTIDYCNNMGKTASFYHSRAWFYAKHVSYKKAAEDYICAIEKLSQIENRITNNDSGMTLGYPTEDFRENMMQCGAKLISLGCELESKNEIVDARNYYELAFKMLNAIRPSTDCIFVELVNLRTKWHETMFDKFVQNWRNLSKKTILKQQLVDQYLLMEEKYEKNCEAIKSNSDNKITRRVVIDHYKRMSDKITKFIDPQIKTNKNTNPQFCKNGS